MINQNFLVQNKITKHLCVFCPLIFSFDGPEYCLSSLVVNYVGIKNFNCESFSIIQRVVISALGAEKRMDNVIISFENTK